MRGALHRLTHLLSETEDKGGGWAIMPAGRDKRILTNFPLKVLLLIAEYI